MNKCFVQNNLTGEIKEISYQKVKGNSYVT